MQQIFIIDDHPIVRSGITLILENTPGIEIIGEAGTIPEAREFLSHQKPDLVLLDLFLEEQSGLEFLKELRANDPKVKVLILSMMEPSTYAKRVLKAGAKGFVAKAQASEELLAAIDLVLSGHVYLSSQVALQLATQTIHPESDYSPHSELACLTDRQLQIFELVGQGLTQTQIADSLGIERRTVESHKAQIRDRLNCQTMAELNAKAAHGSGTDRTAPAVSR
jgi:DNA-binding NarL/FixJ family response regulator